MSGYPKIVVRPPGSRARELVKKDNALISSSYARYYPLVVESGKGCVVRDVDGNEFIDFNSGLMCLNVGHCHPKVVEAIKGQCERFLHSSTSFYYGEVVDLAERLCRITPGRFEKRVHFGTSGTEAVEAALKLSKWHTRRHRFIAFVGAFHGQTLGSLALSASEPVRKRYFFPFLPGVVHVPYPYCFRCPFMLSYPSCDYWCVDFIDEVVLDGCVDSEEVAGLVFEPIQGEGGCIVPPPEYFQRLKRLADRRGFLLIDDEVLTGLGRTGRWFGVEHWKVEPDVLCVAGSVASGLPLGATVANARFMDWEEGSHGSTFGGNPLACVAALAVLDVIVEEGLLENAAKQGNYVMKRLEGLKGECEVVGDVRGLGLMIGIEIVEDKEGKVPGADMAREIVWRCWKRGVVVTVCGASTVRIASPLTVSRELVDAGMDIVEDVIREVGKEKH